MVRLVAVGCLWCAVACSKDPSPEPTVSCPTADELVHGRKLNARGIEAYAIAARRCVDDHWSQAAIRCMRDAKDMDGEDHCYAMLLAPSQRDALATALGALDAPDDASAAPNAE